MRIYLLRHGQSLANAGQSDEIDCGLSDLGRQQAAAAGQALAALGVGLILSSPYRRCLETADAVRAATGAPVELWPAVHEHHHQPFPPGPWPLPARSELLQLWPAFAAPADMPEARWATVPENRDAQWKRLFAAVRDLIARFASEPEAAVAVVTHQAPASVLVQTFCQWTNPLDVRVHIDSGAISILEVDAKGRRHLVALNWTPSSGRESV